MKQAQATGLVIAILIAATSAGFAAYEWLQPVTKPAPKMVADATAETTPAISANQAINISMDDLNGKPHTLADWHGKILLVNFWATWCPPCRREIPLLVKLQAKYAGRGLQIVGIATDEQNAQLVRNFVKPMLLNYPILMGTDQVPEIIAALGGTYVGLPYTLVLDRDGRSIKIHPGELDPKEAETLVHEALTAADSKSSKTVTVSRAN